MSAQKQSETRVHVATIFCLPTPLLNSNGLKAITLAWTLPFKSIIRPHRMYTVHRCRLQIMLWSVCLLVTTMSCAKTAEMLSAVCTRVRPRNHGMHWVGDRIPRGRSNLG